MTVYAYNSNCGWRYNLLARKNSKQKGSANFVWSLITALIVVFIVAELLSALDYHLQNRTMNGFSLTEPFRISSVEAATNYRGSIIQDAESVDLWYVGPNSNRLHFVGTGESVTKILKNFAKTVKNKTFISWKGKAPSSYAGAFIIIPDDLGKTYFINPSDLKPYYFNGTQEAPSVLNSVSKKITNKEFKSFKVAAQFDKPKNLVNSSSATKTTVNTGSNGVDVVKYCSENTFTNPKNDLERTCVKLQQERAAKIAYYESINNNKPAPKPVTPVVAVPSPVPAPVSVPSTTTQPTPSPSTIYNNDGPIIRVGLFSNTAPQTIRATSSFKITDRYGAELLNVEPSQTATVDYIESTGMYSYSINSYSINQTASYLRLIPNQPGAVFEITSYENRPGWNTSLNDNLFLGSLELRHNSSKNRTWVINELPIEQYLKGIAETSNISPMEYQKTMMVAARTYAMYHLNTGTKHGDEYYTVDATYDQVYKGYGATRRLSNVVLAVDATKGQVVTYDGKVVVTPYFSWSDGRTRSMREVWGSDKPYLQSVTEPQGYTKTTLYGHGVGLSAHGALLLASDKYNYSYDQILKYYYQGVSINGNYNSAVAVASSP